MEAIRCAGPAFGGGKYREKRFVEIILLADVGSASDLDFVCDMWQGFFACSAPLARFSNNVQPSACYSA